MLDTMAQGGHNIRRGTTTLRSLDRSFEVDFSKRYLRFKIPTQPGYEVLYVKIGMFMRDQRVRERTEDGAPAPYKGA